MLTLYLGRFGVEFDRLRSGSHTALPVTMMKCRQLEAVLEIVLVLLEAGCQPNLDNVRLAILRAPRLQVPTKYFHCTHGKLHLCQSVLFHAATNPLSLRQLCRKVIWRQLRAGTGGRNIQPGLATLRHEVPDSVLTYLQFTESVVL